VHLRGARSIRLDLARIVLRTPALFVGTPLAASELRQAERAIDGELLWAERRAGEVVVVTAPALDERARRALASRLGVGAVTDHSVEDLVGALAGLDDASLDTLGLGVVDRIDFGARTMTVTTSVAPERIASVSVGRERYRGPSLPRDA
jgi:polynucleotide 5'-kinase involved in rRNA processing